MSQAEQIKQAEDAAWRDQTEFFGPIRDLLEILKVMDARITELESPCNHEYETVLAGGDPAEASSTERVVVCKKCGEEAE